MHKQLEKIVLAAYGKKKHGESTLEIPMKTLAITCVCGLLFAFLISYTFLNYLEGNSKRLLMSNHVPNNVIKGNKDETDIKFERLKKLLTPDIKRKVQDKMFLSEFEELVKNDSISYENFETYLKSLKSFGIEVKTDDLKDYITGKIIIDRELILIYPKFEYTSTPDILEKIGLPKPNLENITNQGLADPLRYCVAANLINKFRRQLSSDYSAPSRLMQALGADIQFITFWFAIWTLMLVGLRFFWCLVQRNVIDTGKLKNDSRPIADANVWLFDNLSNPSDSILSEYRNKYGNGLLPVRIIDEAIELKHENHIPDNIYQFTNDKIDLLESGVQKGEYEIINYLMFAIPNLGFIGTIIGIVLSMASVSGIIESSAQLDQLASFDKVGGALGYAFDTTAVSLFWVLILSLILAFLKKMEADMFESLRAKTIIALKHYWANNS